jgi:hypothetical protein
MSQPDMRPTAARHVDVFSAGCALHVPAEALAELMRSDDDRF